MKWLNKIKRFFTKQTIEVIILEGATEQEVEDFIKLLKDSKYKNVLVTNKKIKFKYKK